MPPRHVRVLGAVAAMAALALAGCGGSESTPPQDASTPAPTTAEHGSFASCLTEHGVSESAASPVGPPADVDPAVWDRAMQACSTLAPGPAGP
ncbi:hypothetical protein [[Mycobacterium] burgundiense]|uniref:Uncharacterized protein n=1 Tax=[Mycobacterium] burgundiense TaxID=3064286 RepID=A0ABN9MWD3_9MYCO|nr:hypothetical protein [Mycolicibacterium sp. MU0053]CAJ1496326.1 hypothetical protein MU0053_000621 [Mycolicibacterium sp. MU0053]